MSRTETEFITARWPEAEMPRMQTEAKMLVRVRGFLRDGEDGRIREAGAREDWGPWRPQGEIVPRIEARVGRMGVGPKLLVQRRRDKEVLSIREVAIAPSIPDLGCNPHIEKSHALTYAEFGDPLLRSGGIWLCRFIEGTRSVSRHGFLDDDPPETWKGSAEDTFVTSGGMEKLTEVARFKVFHAKAGTLTLDNVIVDRTIWSAPNFDPRPYGGVQHFHVHEDAPGGHACSP